MPSVNLSQQWARGTCRQGLVIEALWLVNGGHGASLRHHKYMGSWYLQAVVAGGVERVVAQGLGAQPPEGVEPVVDGDDLPRSSSRTSRAREEWLRFPYVSAHFADPPAYFMIRTASVAEFRTTTSPPCTAQQ
eukprot:COSAG01_NODE_3422_length_6115_cov_4.099402_2_plen_133_part_00